MAGNEQVCAHQKSYSRLIFQNNFGAVMHLSDCSCAPILQFFDAALGAPQQTAKFRTAFLVSFFTSLRKDSVANYASIWTLISPTVRGLGLLYNTLKVS